MKIVYSEYDRNTGMSCVVIDYKGRYKLQGSARLHPDDYDNASEIIGCQYAEARAIANTLMIKLRNLKAKYKDFQEFVQSCEQYKNFDPESPTAKVMYRQLNRRRIEIEKLEKDIEFYKTMPERSEKKREMFRKRVEERKKGKTD